MTKLAGVNMLSNRCRSYAFAGWLGRLSRPGCSSAAAAALGAGWVGKGPERAWSGWLQRGFSLHAKRTCTSGHQNMEQS